MTTVRQTTIDISRFGRKYEDQCQRMLWRGVAYLAEMRPPITMWNTAYTYPSIYGVMIVEGAALKNLEAAIIRPGDDVTGAMHQAVMSHLAYIHQNGVGEWLAEARRHGREPHTWEGAI